MVNNGVHHWQSHICVLNMNFRISMNLELWNKRLTNLTVRFLQSMKPKHTSKMTIKWWVFPGHFTRGIQQVFQILQFWCFYPTPKNILVRGFQTPTNISLLFVGRTSFAGISLKREPRSHRCSRPVQGRRSIREFPLKSQRHLHRGRFMDDPEHLTPATSEGIQKRTFNG